MNPEVTASASTMETSSVKGGIGCKVRHGGDCTNVLQKEVAVQALKKERNPLAQEHQSRDASLGVLRETVLWPTRSPLSLERTRLIWHVSVQTEEGVRWKHLIEDQVRIWACRLELVLQSLKRCRPVPIYTVGRCRIGDHCFRIFFF